MCPLLGEMKHLQSCLSKLHEYKWEGFRGYEPQQLISNTQTFVFHTYQACSSLNAARRDAHRKEMRKESSWTRLKHRRRWKETGATGFPFLFLFARQNVLTNEIGHHRGRNVPCRLASTPLSLCAYFPRTVLRGLRRKCHRFQQWLSSSPRNDCPRFDRLMRPCCPECRLLLSSGRLGIELNTAQDDSFGMKEEEEEEGGGEIAWEGERERGVVVNLERA